MTKSELKTGMVVRYRNGRLRLVLKDTEHQEKDVVVGVDGWLSLDEYDEDLTCLFHSDIDIMYVYNVDQIASYTYLLNTDKLNDSYIHDFGNLIWDRTETETTEMTIKEIEEKLGVKNLRIKD